MIEGLIPLEQAVLDNLLEGDHPVLVRLRIQAGEARLARREYSGVGFFCTFDVPAIAPRVNDMPALHLADVSAEIAGLRHGAGFVLFVRDGKLDMLEGFTFGELWPERIGDFVLRYDHTPRRLEIT